MIGTQRRTKAFILLWVFFIEEGRLQDAGEEDNLVACRHVVSVDRRRSRGPAAAASHSNNRLLFYLSHVSRCADMTLLNSER